MDLTARASCSKRSENFSFDTLMATIRPSSRVAGFVHLAHAAGADQEDDFVRSESSSSR